MPNPGEAAKVLRGWRPEAAVGVLACFIFLGCLGSIELWGKREQRLAAEVLDTIDNGRWLVARIQGRPRLEKPPLPRWTTAALAIASGRCDEWVVRLPGALAALGTIGLTYALGRRIGGRSLGLCAAMILSTTPLFITELRQAGQDGPLAFFTTLALYGAYRRLEDPSDSGEVAAPARRWAVLFHIAMGLGFLCKGPMVLAVVATTVLPFSIVSGRLGRGLRLWADPWGLIAFVALALCWPLPVWLADPNAAGVWIAEMGQKTGVLPMAHRERSVFLLEWPVLVLPWVVAGLSGLLLPFRRDRRDASSWSASAPWFPWFWAIGTLLMLSTWAVAKPNYYVPSLPGWSLLAAMAWVRLDRLALDPTRSGPRRAIRIQWAVWLILGVSALAIPGRWLTATEPTWFAAVVAAASLGGSAVLGAWISRRGGGVLAMLPTVAATALTVVIGYGIVGPQENASRGHREFARRIDRAVPAEINVLSFFHELDEGLWFYQRGRRLVAVPGSQPRYNDAVDARLASDGPAQAPVRLIPRSKQVLADWLAHRETHSGGYLLLRDKIYEHLADELAQVGTVVLDESGSKRNGLILLRLDPAPRTASGPASAPLTR